MSAKEPRPSDLAEWMKSEHQALTELSGVIRKHCALLPETDAGAWLSGLVAAFERLRAHLHRHFAAQESGGYMRMVTENRPTLSREVERLLGEHAQLSLMADRLAKDLAEARPEHRLVTADLSARVQRFIAVVGQHDQRENMITLFVASQDIGVGD